MRWRHKLQCGISIIDGAVEAAAAAAAAASGSCHDVGHTQGHVERVHGRGQGRLYLVAGRGVLDGVQAVPGYDAASGNTKSNSR
jgi:hypothetical protein